MAKNACKVTIGWQKIIFTFEIWPQMSLQTEKIILLILIDLKMITKKASSEHEDAGQIQNEQINDEKSFEN